VQEDFAVSDKGLGIVWGARGIGKEINRTGRQTHYLLEQGAIKAARKVGSQWYAPIGGLHEQFCGGSKSDTERATMTARSELEVPPVEGRKVRAAPPRRKLKLGGIR
jgi:hypothetical protein